MRFLSTFRLHLLAAAATTTVFAQAPLRISHIAAAPQVLSCSAGPLEATVTVQVSFDASAARGKNRDVEVSLSGWSGVPPSNKLKIKELAKNVSLEVSPAIAEFRVSCGPATVPGEVVLFAAIDDPPAGVKTADRSVGPETRVTIKIRGK